MYLYTELKFVVYHRDAGAVDKADACAFPETGKTQEHWSCHEATRHDLDKTIVREPSWKQIRIVMTSASDIMRLLRRFGA